MNDEDFRVVQLLADQRRAIKEAVLRVRARAGSAAERRALDAVLQEAAL